MKTTRSTRLLLSLLLMLLALAPWSTQAAGPLTSCTITDLVPLPSDTFSGAFAINAGGLVVGWSGTLDPSGNLVTHAVLWNPGTTTPTALGTSPGITSSAAIGINDGGVVVGYSGSTAVEWAPGATTPPTALVPFTSSTSTIPLGINASGQVVGEAGTNDANGNPVTHAVLWNAAATPPTELSALPSTANGINANGEVVGYSDSTAVEWTPGATTPTALGPPGTVSDAYAVNASGLVVGASYTQDASRNVVTHAVRWDAAATPPTDLGTLSGITGTLSGITSTVAWGINTSGQVVGAAGTTPNGDTFGHAVLWNAGATTPTDLGDLLPTNSGWRLGTANAINDAEQIVGVGSINGAQHGFRLTCS